MRKYSIKRELLRESKILADKDLMGIGRQVGGGGAQYIVANLVQNAYPKAVVYTAGTSKGDPDVYFEIGGNSYEFEVKAGSGTFDLANVIKSDGVILKKNHKHEGGDQYLITKLQRDSVIVVLEGPDQNIGMTKLRVVKITGVPDEVPDQILKKIFGVAVKKVPVATFAASCDNKENKSRKSSTRIERSITYEKMGSTHKATEIDLTVAINKKIPMTPSQAHQEYMTEYIDTAAQSIYRKNLAPKIGLSETQIKCLQLALDSDGSSCWQTCWIKVKQIYLPIIPKVTDSKYNGWVAACKAALPRFKDEFEKVMGFKLTPTTTLQQVTGVSPKGKTTKKTGPDVTDEALKTQSGSKAAKTGAKAKMVRDFFDDGQIETMEVYIAKYSTDVSDIIRAIRKLNRKIKEKKNRIKSYTKKESIPELLALLDQEEYDLLIEILEETYETSKEDKPKAKPKKAKNDKKSKNKKVQATAKLKSWRKSKGANKEMGVNSKSKWSHDRWDSMKTWLDDRWDPNAKKPWRKVVKTPVELAKLAGKENRIEWKDFKKLKTKMENRKYSLTSRLDEMTNPLTDELDMLPDAGISPDEQQMNFNPRMRRKQQVPVNMPEPMLGDDMWDADDEEMLNLPVDGMQVDDVENTELDVFSEPEDLELAELLDDSDIADTIEVTIEFGEVVELSDDFADQLEDILYADEPGGLLSDEDETDDGIYDDWQ